MHALCPTTIAESRHDPTKYGQAKVTVNALATWIESKESPNNAKNSSTPGRTRAPLFGMHQYSEACSRSGTLDL